MTRLLATPVLLLLAAVGCAGGSTEPRPDPVPTLTLSATAPTASLLPGETVTLAVTATLDGAAVSAAGATFATSNAGVATVSTAGVVTAHTAGSVTITVALTVGSSSAEARRALTVGEGGVLLPEGNTIQNAAGTLVLIAPPGAVAAPTPVALGTTTSPWVDPTLARGAVYSVGTAELTFLAPVTIRARYVAANVPIGLPQDALGLRRAGTASWTDFASTVDSSGGTVTAPITQGGTYSVGRLVPAVPCAGAPYRAFDFWIGQWTLTNPGGASGGSNTITVEAGGCAIFEDYVNPQANLTPGRSISFYNPVTDRWYQTYVDNGGNIARLASTSWAAGAIVTESELLAPSVYRRVTWTLLGNGTVRQFSEYTLNGGSSFTTEYDLTYTRR